MRFKYQPIYFNENIFCYEALYESKQFISSKEKEMFFIENSNNNDMHKKIIDTIICDMENKILKNVSINIPSAFLSYRDNFSFLKHRSKNIIFEISELDDIKDVEKHLHFLKEIGFSLAIDDFGKGFSTLERLKKMSPWIDIIKFDKSWLYTGFFCLSETLKKLQCDHVCIIEGIETKEQYMMAKKCGFKYMQGYFLSKPICVDAL